MKMKILEIEGQKIEKMLFKRKTLELKGHSNIHDQCV